MTKWQELALSWRFACREMRGGLKGFIIFIACIALGVTAIGGVNGVSKSIDEELSRQGQEILAGDMRLSLMQRPANDKELAFLQSQGKLATSIWMRSMARTLDGNDQTMVEVKAVDQHYPLYGTLKTMPQAPTAKLFAKEGDVYGAVAPQILLDRLQIKQGDKIKVGNQLFQITATLVEEPDLLSEGFQLGPRLFMSKEAMQQTGLLQPGSLYANVYKLRIETSNDAQLQTLKDKAEKDFPDAGWAARTRMDAAPGFTNNIERFSQFLTLVGLTSLIVGGVGVANAVRNYMDQKRGVIAIFKSLGASSRLIMQIYFLQIMLIALIGIAIGLVLASAIPFIAAGFLQKYLPILGTAHFYPTALILALVFAFLTTSAFALLPLSRAQRVPVTVLLREFDGQSKQKAGKVAFITASLLLLVAALLAIFYSYDQRMAVIFLVAVAIAFIVLRVVSVLIQWLARRFSHVRSTALRLAIGNIYRPGALTPSVVLALGLGLTLLVALATIDGNLRGQLANSVPEKAPDFFFMDIARNDGEAFAQLLREKDPNGILKIMPTLRARITKINDVLAKDVKVDPDSAWVLRGDRNVTYAAQMPENTEIKAGRWWSDNEGERNQVSVSLREAKGLGLKLGDTITVNTLGHEITAKVSNFRDVDWDSFNMNFVMIFSPETFKGAPHVWLATFKSSLGLGKSRLAADKSSDAAANNGQQDGNGSLAFKNHRDGANNNQQASNNKESDRLKQATTFDEAGLMRTIGQKFPSVTSIPVRQVLADAQVLVGQIGTAIRASATIALLASVLVLAGALSAGNRARAHDAVVLKTLGATRKILMKAFIYEYAILGLATAIFAFLAGSFAGYAIARYKMELTNAGFLAGTAMMVVVVALILSVGFGLVGTWRVLGQKPAQTLKDL